MKWDMYDVIDNIVVPTIFVGVIVGIPLILVIALVLS